jgi:uncharacterized protein YcfJ
VRSVVFILKWGYNYRITLQNGVSMKRIVIASVVSVLATSALAQQIVTRDVAQVTSVQPMMEQVRQPGRCYQVPGQMQPQSNTGMSILGGIVGGAVGSQVGQGDGKLAATALGAGIGAVWGSGQPTNSNQYQQQCEPDSVAERIRGYRVTYTFQGYTSSTVLNYQPGPTIPVVISVSPDTQQQGGSRQQYQGPDYPSQRF